MGMFLAYVRNSAMCSRTNKRRLLQVLTIKKHYQNCISVYSADILTSVCKLQTTVYYNKTNYSSIINKLL